MYVLPGRWPGLAQLQQPPLRLVAFLAARPGAAEAPGAWGRLELWDAAAVPWKDGAVATVLADAGDDEGKRSWKWEVFVDFS